MNKPKIVVIVGPTASGKSDLAVALAKQFNGEVVSADSRQVYRGMDIGSGKITKKEMRGIAHYLLDVANPKRTYSVAQYQKAAHRAIADITKRGKLPIICGGTGLYIQSIVDDLVLPEVPPNAELRRELDKKTTAELFQMLKKMDPARAGAIDQDNPRRLVRAIEIAKYLGQVPALKKHERYETLQIGIKIDFDTLEQKIERRLFARLKQGMIAEVKHLHEDCISWKRLEGFGLEYRYIAEYLQSKITKDEMLTQIKLASRQYAKRQMTWFNKDKRIVWIDNLDRAGALITKFITGQSDQSICND